MSQVFHLGILGMAARAYFILFETLKKSEAESRVQFAI